MMGLISNSYFSKQRISIFQSFPQLSQRPRRGCFLLRRRRVVTTSTSLLFNLSLERWIGRRHCRIFPHPDDYCSVPSFIIDDEFLAKFGRDTWKMQQRNSDRVDRYKTNVNGEEWEDMFENNGRKQKEIIQKFLFWAILLVFF